MYEHNYEAQLPEGPRDTLC